METIETYTKHGFTIKIYPDDVRERELKPIPE